MEKRELLPMGAIVVLLIVAFYLHPVMPDRMATHWNARGEVDGYGSRLMGLFFIPLTTLIAYVLLTLVPKIAVFKKNIRSFYEYYFGFKLIFVLFMTGLYEATIAYNLGYRFNMTFFIVPAISVLFFYLGYIMRFVKRNFFIGIRTPWTLSDDDIWKKTHELGSKTFRLNAIVILMSLVSPENAVWVILVTVLANALFLMVYSYYLYSKTNKKEKPN